MPTFAKVTLNNVSGDLEVDFGAGNYYEINITGATNLVAPVGAVEGMPYFISIGGPGPYGFAWNAVDTAYNIPMWPAITFSEAWRYAMLEGSVPMSSAPPDNRAWTPLLFDTIAPTQAAMFGGATPSEYPVNHAPLIPFLFIDGVMYAMGGNTGWLPAVPR